MHKFRIVPLSAEYAQKIRNSMKDNFGHEVIEQTATGLGPCRVSLKPFKRNVDKRLLFTHSPFETDNAYNQPGPVFIDTEEAVPYKDIYHFPVETKNDKEHFHLTLIGYSKTQIMVITKFIGDADVDELIIKIF
jgi:Protein of unknown function (DUF1203)